MATFTFTVNDRLRTIDASPNTPLLWALRDQIGLTGTKYGCGLGVCGACMVHVDGKAVLSCHRLVGFADGKHVTTIEGLSADRSHPLQRAWLAEDVSQCGFCQPGMIMAAAALLQREPSPDDAAIDRALGHNVCRCGTYQRIRRAVRRAAEEV